jgi:ankyrin repeat protein/uncharacterized protein YceK
VKRFLSILLPFLLSFHLTHCATILTVSRGDLSVYGGVSSSYSIMGVHHPHNPFSGIMDLFLIIDFPFSFALDTVLLPVTGPFSLYNYLQYRKYEKNIPIFEAVRQNDKQQLGTLLAQGYDVNAFENENQVTPLMVAALSSKVEIIKHLIDNKADIKAVTAEKETVLHFALNAESEDAYKFLSTYEIPITNAGIVFQAARSGKGFAFLDLLKKIPNAIKEKEIGTDKNIVMLAIENSIPESSILKIMDQVDIMEMDSEGNQLVHYAAKYGMLKVLDFLISKKMPIDKVNNNNETPFILAVQNNQLESVKYLYDRKVDIQSKNNQSALDFSIGHESDAIFKFLISKNFKISDPSMLFYAISTDKKSIVNILLTKIPNAHLLSYEDKGLIHYAAMHDHVGAIKYCISKNVPVDQKDKLTGETPLVLAWNYGRLEAFEYLLKNKANINQVVGENGNTFLHEYVLNNNSNVDSLNLLLKYNINKRIRNGEGRTAYEVLAESPLPQEEILRKIKP